jgi:hypothetical protein
MIESNRLETQFRYEYDAISEAQSERRTSQTTKRLCLHIPVTKLTAI